MNAEQSVVAAPEQSLPQLQQRLLHVVTQLDHMQSKLDALHAETLDGANQVAALTQNLTGPQFTASLTGQIAELATNVEQNAIQLEQLRDKLATIPRGDQLEELAQSIQQVASNTELGRLTERVDQLAQREQIDALANNLASSLASQDELANLTTEFKRLSRTQFKTNALHEGKEQQTASAISTLQEIVTRRETRQDEQAIQERNRMKQIRTEARGELAADLLPALDGLELAIRNGQALMAKTTSSTVKIQPPKSVTPPQKKKRSWLGRLFFGQAEQAPSIVQSHQKVEPTTDAISESISAWLDGLRLSRDRFLALLAAEGIQPIPAQDQAFDPRLHVAVEKEVRKDVAPNRVVRVIRQGYQQQQRVLRYAEVVVSTNDANPTQADPKQAHPKSKDGAKHNP